MTNFLDIETTLKMMRISSRYLKLLNDNIDRICVAQLPHLKSFMSALYLADQPDIVKNIAVAQVRQHHNSKDNLLENMLPASGKITLYYPTYVSVVPKLNKTTSEKNNKFYLSQEDIKSNVSNFSDIQGFYKISFMKPSIDLLSLLKNGVVNFNCTIKEEDVVERVTTPAKK